MQSTLPRRDAQELEYVSHEYAVIVDDTRYLPDGRSSKAHVNTATRAKALAKDWKDQNAIAYKRTREGWQKL